MHFHKKKSAPEALILPGCEKCPFLAGNKPQKSDMGTPLGRCNSGLLNIAVIKSMPLKEPPHELKYWRIMDTGLISYSGFNNPEKSMSTMGGLITRGGGYFNAK